MVTYDTAQNDYAGKLNNLLLNIDVKLHRISVTQDVLPGMKYETPKPAESGWKPPIFCTASFFSLVAAQLLKHCKSVFKKLHRNFSETVLDPWEPQKVAMLHRRFANVATQFVK